MADDAPEHEDREGDDGGERVVPLEGGRRDPEDPIGQLASPTSHWKGLGAHPMLSATRLGVKRWPLPRMIPLTPMSHRTPTSSAVCFQSSTPPISRMARSMTKPATGT
jgi:hypothetical protein